MGKEVNDDPTSVLPTDIIAGEEDTTDIPLQHGESKVEPHTGGLAGRIKQITGKYSTDTFQVMVEDRTVTVQRKDSLDSPVAPYTYYLNTDGSGIVKAGYPSPKID